MNHKDLNQDGEDSEKEEEYGSAEVVADIRLTIYSSRVQLILKREQKSDL